MTVIDFAEKLAVETGEILGSYYQHSGIKATYKEDHSVLTQADLAADQHIRERLKSAFPSDGILSEEENTHFPENKEYVWVVDPLDGTTNFSLGLHYWGVSIARLKNGQPDVSALYYPLLDELYLAEAGKGGWFNGAKLETVTTDRTTPYFACDSRTHQRYQVQLRFKTRILGAASYNFLSVAKNSAVLAFEVTPKVWDFAGAWLVVKEAGAFIEAYDQSALFPLVPGEEYKSKSIPILVAVSPELLKEAREKIIKK